MLSNIICLPYPSFQASIDCYSARTLRQTLREAAKISEWLLEPRSSCVRPSMTQSYLAWRHWPGAFASFAARCINTCEKRDLPLPAHSVGVLEKFFQDKGSTRLEKPLWLGWTRVHTVHRQLLLWAGKAEQLMDRLKLISCDHVDLFWSLSGLSCAEDLYSLNPGTVHRLHRLLDEYQTPLAAENHYEQHFPGVIVDDTVILYHRTKEDYYV